jgi:hypothetical protein
MTRADTAGPPDIIRQRLPELAVPLLSFGGTLAGILLWNMGFHFGIQYAAFGCVLGSCILAWLAWIRPKKDIVALTTPVYAFIFFVAPTDFLPGITLQLLFATSLTILLVRLKYRFGAPKAPVPKGTVLAEPLAAYVDRVRDSVSSLAPEVAKSAGEVFIRFGRGEYGAAAHGANLAIGQLEQVTDAAILTRAFSILSEQARSMERSLHIPESYLKFAPEHSRLLANPDPASADAEQAYHTTLYNALLLLYAAAWNSPGADRSRLLAYRDFAMRLFVQ